VQIDLHPRGAEGARRRHQPDRDRAHRRNTAEHDDEEGERDGENDLLQKTDAEGENEDREKDRLRDREQQMQRRREHAIGGKILAEKESDCEPERADDGERHGDLGQRDGEIAAEALVLQQSGKDAQHLRERRQEPRIDEAGAAPRFPERRQQRDEDEGRKPGEPPRHGRAPLRGQRAAVGRNALV
jgi:hypothetical protein